MVIKRVLVSLFILFFSENLFANSEISYNSTKPFCSGDFYKTDSNNLKIEYLNIKIHKNKSWIKNLLNLHLLLEKKDNVKEHKTWISNFRITDNFKKKFKADVNVKFEGNKFCKFDAKVRVTGDLYWHIGWIKGAPISSLQIELLNGNIHNITQFKLFLKEARFGRNEVFVSNLFKELDFMSPKTFFLKTKINNVGVEYIFQEDIKKELLEKSFYREGPILEGDERFSVNLTEKEKVEFPNINYAKVINKEFSEKNYSNSSTSLEALSNLNRLYLYNHKYKEEKKIVEKISAIFYLFTNKFFLKENAEILNIYEALSYALDTKHGLSVDDRRFYYDSFNKFYLPIYYDGKSKILEKTQYLNLNKDIKKNNWSNEAIQGAQGAIYLIESLNLGDLLKKLKNSGMKISHPELKNVIKKILTRLYILNKSNTAEINIAENNDFFPKVKKKKESVKFIFSNHIKKNFSVCNYDLKKCEIFKPTNIKYFQILNQSMNQNFNILKKKLRSKDNMVFLFNNFNKDMKNIDFKYSEWKFLNNLNKTKTKIKYKDVVVKVDKKKRTISIDQKTNKGKIIFLGGKLENWNIKFTGLTNVGREDIINNFDISNNLTGCLSFYEIEFKLINIESVNSSCEDSVNIIRSSGTINNIKIDNSASDGLDVDFSNLFIKDIKITSAINDCVDFSSGTYNLGFLDLKKCGDKALSVGEKSFVELDEINVNYSDIGLASKDSSIVNLKKGNLNNSKICLSAYNKKQEYDGGFININNLNCTNYSKKANADVYSKILLKNKILKNDELKDL
jgi:hypothetical protein